VSSDAESEVGDSSGSESSSEAGSDVEEEMEPQLLEHLAQNGSSVQPPPLPQVCLSLILHITFPL